MRKRSKESIDGVAPVLTPPNLSVIHDLNHDYIQLLTADRDVQQFSCWLPATVIAGLAELDTAPRRALAACPFALFSPGIEHPDFWRAVTADATEDKQRYRLQTPLSAMSFFTMNALFFAWHLARAQRMAAKVFFALPEFAVDGLARLHLWELQRIAVTAATLMRPRWPMNTAFWPDLVRFAGRGDTERLNTTQLLGTQLIAADLRVHAASRSSMRSLLTLPPRVTTASLPVS